jgi:hypothetical protein
VLRLDQRAGPYHYYDSFKQGHTGAYEQALAVFGTLSGFKLAGNLCRVTWARAGVSIGFASENAPCATGHLYEAAWYGMTLFGKGGI